ncbi:OmpP1/FadL family transporter [Pararhodospirillum photometricum]|uniref:Membrane protein involved in aromatic hydrocarbon degradation n=1 Tax=Pararhodospirillum photometricum DSM 122 TaxID=1150469 RepID=H6SPB7_PARPM|nr:outer membrane protein transport protein [Pararhodospirillum photometricum]CCG09442.1 Membrane protein involved in aromatic hydrocarbon degradation [Pararhodospirillum photometricum DSM 122]
MTISQERRRGSRQGGAGVALGVLVAVGISSQAQAAGFQLREQSSEGLGNAFAGSTAKAYNLSTIYYNPAGMTRLSGNQTAGSATWIAPVSKFSGSNTFANGRQTVGSQGDDAIEDAAVGATYLFWDAKPDLKFGLALTSPYGLRSNYEKDWVGRYHALESSITNINLSPSIAYRINDQLSIGGAIQLAYVDVTLSQALNLSSLGFADGRTKVNGHDFGVGFDIGALYEFTPQTRVGVNWRSEMNYTLKGNAEYRVPAALAAAMATLRDTDAQADLTTPDTVSLGVYHEITPQWAVMSDIAWTNWSDFDDIRIKYTDGRPQSITEENWRDTWFFSVGTTYHLNQTHAFNFGVAYDQGAVYDKYRTARIPDSNRYWVSAGYTYDFGNGDNINLGYTHIFADAAKINETGSVASAGTLRGEYDSHVDIFSASFVYKF